MAPAAQRGPSFLDEKGPEMVFPLPPKSTCKSNVTPSKLPNAIKKLNKVGVEKQMSRRGKSNFNRDHLQGREGVGVRPH